MTIYFHGLPGWLQLQQHFTGENKINSGVRKKKAIIIVNRRIPFFSINIYLF